MHTSGQQRFFPEGWAKRVNIPGKTNGIVTSSNPSKVNVVSEVFSECNNSKRFTQAVDRIIESIQQRRRSTQRTGNNQDKSTTYNHAQPTFLNSQSCHHRLPSEFVQRSRVQQIIDDFLHKARKRGLGGRTSKERNNPPEEIQCHPVSRQSYKPREGKEITLSVKEYLPPAEHKNLLLDANRSDFDTQFHHTCSSGIYSPGLSIRSDSPDLFDLQRNKVNSENDLKQPVNIIDKETSFGLFDHLHGIHFSKSDYNEIIQPSDLYFSQYSRKMQHSPRMVEFPLFPNNNSTNNFSVINNRSAHAMVSETIPTNVYHNRQRTLSQNQFNQYEEQALRSYDIGLCKNCQMLYSKQTNTNLQIDNILNFNPNVFQNTRKSNSTNKFSKDNWKFNFSSQPYNVNNLNFYPIETNRDEFQDFLDDCKSRHCMTTGFEQFNGHNNCCMNNYFKNLGSGQVFQHNFDKFTSKFTKAHAHTLKHHESSPEFKLVFPFKVINTECNKLNETYICNQDNQNEDIVKHFPNEQKNDFIYNKNVNALKHVDCSKSNLNLEQEEKTHSLGLPYLPDKINNLKSAKTSTVSTQTYSTDEGCEDTFCIPYREQNFNMEKTYCTKCLNGSKFKRETPSAEEINTYDESIITSDFITKQLPILSSTKNHIYKPLATSTPSGGGADDNKKIDENKPKMKTKQLTDAYYSFQIPRKITRDISSDTIMNNTDESESFLILNLLKSAGRSISFENIDYINNEE
ncbi:unnamed protein product [Schistosoma margrebowiei]|uniref:Uncharacterized protein n=1 Tax=Schistosoma margrebowiei TaxID=48269 RepID=A0AA84ZPV5_9TREM|nr:unnamed protein product [Schistosoma margrebowiei]